MGTKLPSTLLIKYHKLIEVHSRALGLKPQPLLKRNYRCECIAQSFFNEIMINIKKF